MTLGGASVIGTGAFTSVRAERSISVDVVEDDGAFLKLEPCHDSTEEVGGTDQTEYEDDIPESSDFVYQSSGTIRIDLTATGDDPRDGISGDGITKNSLWRFPNAFQITNQGTQAVGVDLKLEDSSGDVPKVKDGGNLDGHHIDSNDPAVVFYKGGDNDERFDSHSLDPDAAGSAHLETGKSICIGFDIRTLGLSGDALDDLTLRIKAAARAEADTSVGGGTQRSLVFGGQRGNSGNSSDSQPIRVLQISADGIGTVEEPSNANINAIGPFYDFSNIGSRAPVLRNSDTIDLVGGENKEFSIRHANTSETLLGVGTFGEHSDAVFYTGGTDGNRGGEIYAVTNNGDAQPDVEVSGTTAVSIAGIGDIDGDGDNEIVFVYKKEQDEFEVGYVEYNGDEINTIKPEDSQNSIKISSANSIGQPAVLDGGVKIPAILPADNDHNTIALLELADDDDQALWTSTTVLDTIDAAQAPLAAVDIDGDRNPDIVYVAEGNDSSHILKTIDPSTNDPESKKIVDSDGESIEASTNTGVA
jgi:hypothetical protein